MKKLFYKFIISSFMTIFILFFSNCNFLVDFVRYATQESYVSGKEAKNRIETAAYIGYGINSNNDMQNATVMAPLISIMAARIKDDRDYLETSIESCEENVLYSNALGLSITDQLFAGVFCNLGPGKRPDQL